MTVPKTLVSPTLATLYMQQGYEEAAIAVLRVLGEQHTQRKAEFLTRLLTQVSITARGRHVIQRNAHVDNHSAA